MRIATAGSIGRSVSMVFSKLQEALDNAKCKHCFLSVVRRGFAGVDYYFIKVNRYPC